MGYQNEKGDWESDETAAMGKIVVPALIVAGIMILRIFFWH